MVLVARKELSASEVLNDIFSLVGQPGKDFAFGGAYDGAARFDHQLAGWSPPLNSADLDILPDKELLDARSRDSLRNDAYLQGGATLHKDGIVGSLYFLNSKPDYDTLGFTAEWAEEFQKEVEAKFTLWAESPRKWVDAARQNTFTSMIRLGVGVYTGGGEVLATVEWLRDKGREFNTAIQMVDTDRLSTPTELQWDNNVRGGVRMNQYGAPQSYFIRVKHQHDINIWRGMGDLRWKEVDAEKPWGRQQVIYIREQMRVDQTRAVADIVAGLKEIAITRKFRDVTLQNAVVNAMYAASIESELPPEAAYAQIGGGNIGEAITGYAEAYLSAINEYVGSSKHMKIDGVKIRISSPARSCSFARRAPPAASGRTSSSRFSATSRPRSACPTRNCLGTTPRPIIRPRARRWRTLGSSCSPGRRSSPTAWRTRSSVCGWKRRSTRTCFGPSRPTPPGCSTPTACSTSCSRPCASATGSARRAARSTN